MEKIMKNIKKNMTTAIRKIPALLTVAALLSGTAFASGEGTSTAQFLKIGAGSKPAAMADAYTALADDIYSVYYNPAGLAWMDRPEFAGQLTNYFQDSDYGFMAFALPIEGSDGTVRHTLGISVYSLKVNSIDRRTQDTDSNAGLFDATDMAYALSYGYRISKQLGIGVSGKYIRGQIDDVKASAFAADAGIRYQCEELPLSAAVMVKNIGTKMKYGQESDPLPSGVAVGLGYRFMDDRLKIGVDAVKYRDFRLYGAVGGDYTQEFMDKLSGSLRAGYTSHNTDPGGFNGFTFGAGMRYSKVGFDFAWVPFGDLGNTFRYTLSVKF